MRAVPPLYILRHGETIWNRAGRLQGRFDAPLTDLGLRQARQQAAILRRAAPGRLPIYASPQGRAFKTARIASPSCRAVVIGCPALREVGLGAWAGQMRASLLAQTDAPDGYALYDLAPGGEGLDALHARCLRFLRGLDHAAVLVTHGITSRMIRLILTQQPMTALKDIGGGQGIVWRVADGAQVKLA